MEPGEFFMARVRVAVAVNDGLWVGHGDGGLAVSVERRPALLLGWVKSVDRCDWVRIDASSWFTGTRRGLVCLSEFLFLGVYGVLTPFENLLLS